MTLSANSNKLRTELLHTYVLSEWIFGGLNGQLVMGGLLSVLPRSPRRQGGIPRAVDRAAKGVLGATGPLTACAAVS